MYNLVHIMYCNFILDLNSSSSSIETPALEAIYPPSNPDTPRTGDIAINISPS